ncbi:MAG: isoprenylcysteine carboxylmethyltransferase family protein [Methanomassiliicoccus sp.]|nr:isoprenylcysteine carboxylmethyltransferase family protein [Methanomassiliicoccus sp.]
MERQHHESPLFTLLLFVILFSGLIASALDPTGIAAAQGRVTDIGTLSGVQFALFIIGSALVLMGFIIRFVAIVTLKRNFSGRLRIREGHTLTTNGIYHWVRHPAYLGAILLFLGIPVMFSSLLGFLVMSLLIPCLLHRIKLEERMMIGQFGAEYEEYTRYSKKLIPFIY